MNPVSIGETVLDRLPVGDAAAVLLHPAEFDDASPRDRDRITNQGGYW